MSPTQKLVAETLERIVKQNDELIKILKELALPSRPTPADIDDIDSVISTEPQENGPIEAEVIDDKPLISPAAQDFVLQDLIENKVLKKPRKKSDGRGIPVWQAYDSAYEQRYKVRPVRNAMTNRICSQLADRLGENAAHVVVFYVHHNDFFYGKNAHPLTLCLKDAEKLHMEWSRGHRVTTAEARQQERQGHNAQVVEAVLNDN